MGPGRLTTPGYLKDMIEVMADEPTTLTTYAADVNMAYAFAQQSSWDISSRVQLWDATIAAVLAYAASPQAAAEAKRFYLLLIDLTGDIESAVVAGWSDDQQRAVRIAATRALACASQPHHRPRAQALLKRLDTLADPALQAREQVLLSVSRQRQALHQQQVQAAGTEQGADRPLSTVMLESRFQLLGRLNDVLRGLPREPLEGRAGPIFVVTMQELKELVESDRLFAPTSRVLLFELLQRAMAPTMADLGLGPAIVALEAIRAQTHPGVQAACLMLEEMVFALDLFEFQGERRTRLVAHLREVALVASHLMDIPSASLPAMLFRLAQRLADPGNDTLEPLIDEALATLESLVQHRSEAASLVESYIGATDDDGRLALLQARKHQRELDALLTALQGLRLAGVGPLDVPGVLGLLRQVLALATAPGLEPQAFEHVSRALAQQLARPRLARDRVWQAATAAIGQLSAHRLALEDSMRGLAFERQLTPSQKIARQKQLEFQVPALDQARMVLASLPLEGLPAVCEEKALLAIAELTLAMRRVVSGQDPFGLRPAVDDVVASISPIRS